MIGQVLNDRYEILERLGEGGMAIAYRGRDRLLGRQVAVKVMRPELAASEPFLPRFRREARAAAGITHEHIASVYDTGSDGPYHYIVMEYVDGESLKHRLRREGPLPLAEALRIATETAEALEAAHQAGVVHRDIKPHNILLGREGRVKVTDFGIAGAAFSSPAGGQPETSTIVGSVHYLSPEQARGDAVGPQADLYSLGVTLFEMLTGRPPFDGGDRIAILHKHIYDLPPRVTELRPGLPAEVDSIVGHCLEKDLSRRFASARELLSYLSACPRTEEAAARRRAGWPRRLGRRRPSARRPAGWWLALTAVLLAGGGAGLALWTSGRSSAGLVPVPDVVGMSPVAARVLLSSKGLGYREVGSRPDNDVAAGSVLTQDPLPNAEAPSGAVVKVVLSQGASRVVVPEVTQMSVAQAQRNLEAAGLATGAVREAYDAKVPAGYVASTLPAAGARVVPGTVVDMVVSLGPESASLAGQAGGAAPGSPTPASGQHSREETLSFVVPADAGGGEEVEVVVEVNNQDGRRRIYQGLHRPGQRIPPQKIVITGPTTARIRVNGEVRAERQYLP